jgi:hypothetical protein
VRIDHGTDFFTPQSNLAARNATEGGICLRANLYDLAVWSG